jgi:oligoendopeptidase F
LRDYHGHDQGVVRVADRFAIEWAAVPHFYYNFYVFKYATGIIAATALSRSVIDRTPGAREAYLRFLGAGGSDYPLALLRHAGVDLESERPYGESFAAVDAQIDRLEACLTAISEA